MDRAADADLRSPPHRIPDRLVLVRPPMNRVGEFAKGVVLEVVMAGYAKATNHEIAKRAGYSRVAVNLCLRGLEAEGKIIRRRVGRRREIAVLL